MKAVELKYHMDRVERDIRKLGQMMEELIESSKYFMQGSQAKPPI